ncbi:FecR family protein [Chryseolinea lacunae]|uniref:FecR domain-containing protein n=1 Tax=Chryseolinea lacunae TaxID=2801331 RepID=A0ABS1KJJ1_9BACT|nr:FecR domain-containing protein [Chryseolinea lacunae]
MKKGNDIDITDELMVRYLCGEASPEEAMALQDALKDLRHQSRFVELQDTWRDVHPQQPVRRVNAKAAWLDVAPQLKEEQALPVSVPSRWARLNRQAFRVAATVLALVVSGVVLYAVLRTTPGDENATYIATAENLQHVNLPDQSIATVFRNSRLSYSNEFNSHHREVNLLEGEAFFKVTRDRKNPFIIHTAVGNIKVIGTAFNVVLKDGALVVSVMEGKVLVYTDTDSTYLEAGATGRAEKSGNIETTDSVNANEWGYATHRFVFNDAPLRDVIRDLEKAYPCTIKVSDTNITNCRLTATFENDSAENLLTLVAESLNLSVASSGTIFTLEGEGCP